MKSKIMTIIGLIVIGLGSYIIYEANWAKTKKTVEDDGKKTRHHFDQGLQEFKKAYKFNENVDALLEQLLGHNYKEKLEDDKIRTNLLKMLDGRNLTQLIQEIEFLKTKTLETVDHEFIEVIQSLFSRFDYEGVRKEIDEILSEGNRYTNNELSGLYFLKMISFLLEGRIDEVMTEASFIVKLTKSYVAKAAIIDVFIRHKIAGNSQKLFHQEYSSLAKSVPKDDPDLVIFLLASGDLMSLLQQMDLANYYFDKALELSELHFDENHNNTFLVYKSLGTFNVKTGNLDKAENYLKKAIDISNKIDLRDKDHQALAKMELGRVFFRKEKFLIAVNHYKEAEKDLLEKPENEKTRVYVLFKLFMGFADAYTMLGDFPNAKKYFDRAFYFRNNLNRHETARLHMSLGHYYNGKEMYSKALENYQIFLDLSLVIFPDNHPSIIHGKHLVEKCKIKIK